MEPTCWEPSTNHQGVGFAHLRSTRLLIETRKLYVVKQKFASTASLRDGVLLRVELAPYDRGLVGPRRDLLLYERRFIRLDSPPLVASLGDLAQNASARDAPRIARK